MAVSYLDKKYERSTLDLSQEIQEIKATCSHHVGRTEQQFDRPAISPVTANPNLVEPPDSALTEDEPDKQTRKTSTPAKDCAGVSNVKTRQADIPLINEAGEQPETGEHPTPTLPRESVPGIQATEKGNFEVTATQEEEMDTQSQMLSPNPIPETPKPKPPKLRQ